MRLELALRIRGSQKPGDIECLSHPLSSNLLSGSETPMVHGSAELGRKPKSLGQRPSLPGRELPASGQLQINGF